MAFIAAYWWVWLTGYIVVMIFGVVVFPRIEGLIEREQWNTLRVIAGISTIGAFSAVTLFVSVLCNIVLALA